MSQLAIPKTAAYPIKRQATSKVVVLASALVAFGVLAGGGYWATRHFGGTGGGDGRFTIVTAVNKPFEIRLHTNGGEVQAVDNIDIPCNVEGINTLTTLIPEGSVVEKGQVLAVVDSSAINLKLEDGTIELERAIADLTSAKELAEIQKSTNAANIEAAQVALELAQLDLKKYVEGSYPQLEADAKTELSMAEITLKNKQEDLAQTRSLFSKGFVTATEIKSKELEVTTASNALAKARTSLEVLRSYSNVMDLTSKKNALVQAEQKVARTRRENSANLSKLEADVRAKSQALEVNKRRIDRLNQQLAACTIKAPAAGLVVYNNNDRSDEPLAEGSQVRERQVLLRLPDVSAMKVVTRVNESLVGRLRAGQHADVVITNVPGVVSAELSKISVMSDAGRGWMNPDVKEYPVDLVLKYTPPGLKPGMRADSSILIDKVDQALVVPLGALYTAGSKKFVFTPDGDTAKPQEVQTGRMNDEEIEITSGLAAGGRVVLLEAGQGKILLDQAGVKQESATQPTDSKDDDPTAADRRSKKNLAPTSRPAGPPKPGARVPERRPEPAAAPAVAEPAVPDSTTEAPAGGATGN